MVNRVHRFLDLELGITGYQFHGFTTQGSSYYFVTGSLVIRVSDHPQAEFGGYDIERGERHTKADVSISPTEQSFEDFVAAFRADQADQITSTSDREHCDHGRIRDYCSRCRI